MSTTNEPAEIRQWLSRLQRALASVSAPEREDIMEETRSHLAERIEGGLTPSEALAGFGTAETYARTLLDEIEVSAALGSQRSGQMLSALGRRVHRSLIAASAFIALALIASLAFGIVVTAVFKLFDPIHVGLWCGKYQLFFGVIDDPAKARELLGNWIFSVAFLSVAFAWLAGRFVLLRALRSIAHAR
jgi:hypothetical protein